MDKKIKKELYWAQLDNNMSFNKRHSGGENYYQKPISRKLHMIQENW